MSYYTEHSDSKFSWGFCGVLVLIMIVLLLMRSCESAVEWNDGICSDCGGNYVFQQAIGHRTLTDYMYVCDKCGRKIEIGQYYPDKNN